MRRTDRILIFICLLFASVVAVVFAFVEFRSLFAGDFTLMNNKVLAFFAILFRGLYYVAFGYCAIHLIVNVLRNKKINQFLVTLSLALFIGSFFTFAFYEYYIALLIIVMNLLVSVVAVAHILKLKN